MTSPSDLNLVALEAAIAHANDCWANGESFGPCVAAAIAHYIANSPPKLHDELWDLRDMNKGLLQACQQAQADRERLMHELTGRLSEVESFARHATVALSHAREMEGYGVIAAMYLEPLRAIVSRMPKPSSGS